jgi:hypothetical protein
MKEIGVKKKDSPLKPKPTDTPISTVYHNNLKKEKVSDASHSNSRPSLVQKSPPRKVIKFYEKGDPTQIVDLSSTSMFKRGLLNSVHNKDGHQSVERIKKKGYLKQMEEILTQMKNGENSNHVKKNIFSIDNTTQAPGSDPKKDLFFRRYTKLPTPTTRIDHDAIKYHSASFKVSQLEADKKREDTRKQFVEEWKRNQHSGSYARSVENYNSYKNRYKDQLEKSIEAQKTIERLRENRVNRYLYGEMLKKLAGLKPNSSLDHKRHADTNSPSKTKEQARNKELELLKKKKEIGSAYLKFSIGVGREKLMSPKVMLKSTTNKSLDDSGNLNLRDHKNLKKGKKRTKEQIKSMYNVKDIFTKKDILADDKGGNYSKLEHIRKMDNFTTPATQNMAVNTLKEIDRELKLKEKEIKNGVEHGENIDVEYLRSIKAKIEVINQRINTKLESFEKEKGGKKGSSEDKGDELISKNTDGKKARAKSAMRPPQQRSSDLQEVQDQGKKSQNDKREDTKGGMIAKNEPSKIQLGQKGPRLPQREGKPSDISDIELKKNQKSLDQVNQKKEESSRPRENSKPKFKPNENSNQKQVEQPTKEQVHKKELPNKTEDTKKNKKELHIHEISPNMNYGTDEKDPGLDSPHPSLANEGVKRLSKEDKEHPLIKKLSQDLDEDPSESYNRSHHERKQQELGDFFSKKMPGEQDNPLKQNLQTKVQDDLDEF